jgi:hypothetical protein
MRPRPALTLTLAVDSRGAIDTTAGASGERAQTLVRAER